MHLGQQLAVDLMTDEQLWGRLQRETCEALSEAEWRNGCSSIVHALHISEAVVFELKKRAAQTALF